MPRIDNKSLSDHVYENIRNMILNGDLPAGEKINKNDLVERLEVSLTPINAAISRLVGEKLIEQRSRYGFFVKDFDCRELQDLYAVRAGLEGIAIRLCIENGCEDELEYLAGFFAEFSLPMSDEEKRRYAKEDKKFHSTIVEYSANQMIRDMNMSYSYVIRSYQKGLIRPPEETLEEHHAIVQAIKDRDGFQAQEMIIQHHLKSKEKLKQNCDTHQQAAELDA